MKEIQLTQGYIALVDDEDYDRVNDFKWQIHKNKNNLYARRSIFKGLPKRKVIYLHRFILSVEDENIDVDHRDNYGLNCQKYNMRICTRSQNLMNRRKTKNCTSKYKGVYFNKQSNKFIAHIQFNKIRIHLGYFKNEIEAAKAYDEKAKELFGEFIKLNFN